jgi:hypothetical protein
MKSTSPVLLFISLLLIVGCTGTSITTPSDQSAGSRQSLNLGWFSIDYDESSGTLAVNPIDSLNRSAQIDVTKMAQIGIDSMEWNPDTRNWTLDCWIKNPTSLTGYGVWVVFTELGGKEIIGQDGYIWLPGDPDQIRAPFIAVGKDQELRVFPAQHQEDVTLVIHWPEGVDKWIPIEFFIDASWPAERLTPMVENLSSGNDGAVDTLYWINAWVADFQDPYDTLTVYADLTPLGGLPVIRLYDDGEHQDGDLGDSIFGCTFNSTAQPADYTITVYASDPGANKMENDVAVTIVDITPEPYITVITPNGGEVLESGFDYEVTWESGNFDGTVHIEYSKDDFVSDSHYIGPNEPNDGSFLWEDIPNDPSDTVKVRISSFDNPTIFDLSDDYFSIVTGPEKTITIVQPNGGEEWITGSKHEIQWTSEYVEGQVGLAWSTDNFAGDITSIAVHEENDGSYLWTVPLVECEEAWVRVISEDETWIYDISDAPFAIIKDPDDPCRPFREIRNGTHSNGEMEAEYAIRSEQEWIDHLGWFSPMPNPPNLDWDEEMAIVLIYGERNSSGYYFEMNDICLDDADVLHVDYNKWYPGPGCMVLWVFTQPYSVVTTETYPGTIVFDKHLVEDPCD